MPTTAYRRGPTHLGELMFDDVKFGVSDFAASKAFFLEALEPLGVAVVAEEPPTYGVELCPKGEASLFIYQTEEKPAHLHLAFTAENRQQVEAFYRAALEAGGKDHGAPGSARAVQRELLRGVRDWAGRAQHRSGLPRASGLTFPSRGRPHRRASPACGRPSCQTLGAKEESHVCRHVLPPAVAVSSRPRSSASLYASPSATAWHANAELAASLASKPGFLARRIDLGHLN